LFVKIDFRQNRPHGKLFLGRILFLPKGKAEIKDMLNLFKVENILIDFMEFFGLDIQGFPIDFLADTDFKSMRYLDKISQLICVSVQGIGTSAQRRSIFFEL